MNGLGLKIDKGTEKEIRIYQFEPDTMARVIKAKRQGSKLLFTAKAGNNDDEFILEWCGELKHAISQAIVNNLAAQLSRVGLDTFEWSRFKSPLEILILNGTCRATALKLD